MWADIHTAHTARERYRGQDKINPQRTAFTDREAVVVDDSLVRGTTAGRIVSMIRESGAKKSTSV